MGELVRPEADGLPRTDHPAARIAAIRVPDAGELLALVRGDPCAVGVVGLTDLEEGAETITVDGVRPTRWSRRDGSYPLGYTVRVVHRGAPNRRLQRFFEFLGSQRGQELLSRHLTL